MTRSPAILRGVTLRRRRAFHPRAEGLEGRLLMSAGDLDTSTFSSPNGHVRWSSPVPKGATPFDIAQAVAIQPDGRILVAGNPIGNSNRFEVIRLNANGSLDDGTVNDSTPGDAFGSAGLALPLSGGNLSDIALQPDGRILLTGNVGGDVVLIRLLGNGALDTGFGQGGKVITQVSTAGDLLDDVYAVGLQSDGKIVLAGVTYGSSATTYDSLLLRYNANGSLDTTFGQGGKVVTAWSAGEDNVFDLKFQSDGKIVVAGKGYGEGNGRYPYFVARYNVNGSLDDGSAADSTPGDSFGAVGIVTTPFSASSPGGAGPGHPLALQPDGAIVFGRLAWNGTDNDLAITRFTTTGSLDTTFGGGTGAVIVNLGGSERASALAIQPDGKIIAAGSTASDTLLARFQTNGALDPGFGSGGVVIRSFSTSSDSFNDVALQADGKVVAVGSAWVSVNRKTNTPAFLIARHLGDPAPLRVASAASPPVREALTAAGARPMLARAMAYWRSRGADVSRLRRVSLAVSDLGGDRLGEASGTTITLDDNAAGWGWALVRGRGAPGRVGLLPVLRHEVGHLLGRGHAEGGVMAETIAPQAVIARAFLRAPGRRHQAPARG